VADAIQIALEPTGALVLIEAEHLCMSMRGVRTPGSKTITSAVRGLIQTNDATRAEVFSLINAPR
jgi:GTP cyclohydrolase I